MRRLAIDLGTTHTRICIRGKGVVVNEPSVIARSLDTDKIIAVGTAAEEMIGRLGDDIEAVRPVHNGVIADFTGTERMLSHFIQRAIGRWHIGQPEAMITVPSGATSTEQRAVLDVGRRAGLRNVYLIPSGVASALGAGLPIIEPRGHMLIDIGSDTTEISVLSLGGVVARRSLRIGSNAISDAIIRYLKRGHGLLVGFHAAEEIKRLIGSVGDQPVHAIRIRGRSTTESKPLSIELSSADTRGVIEATLERIVLSTRMVVEKTPPDLVSDIIEHGITLTGGGSNLGGIAQYLSGRLNAPCKKAQDPLLCSVKGAYLALTHLQDYKRSLLGIS